MSVVKAADSSKPLIDPTASYDSAPLKTIDFMPPPLHSSVASVANPSVSFNQTDFHNGGWRNFAVPSDEQKLRNFYVKGERKGDKLIYKLVKETASSRIFSCCFPSSCCSNNTYWYGAEAAAIIRAIILGRVPSNYYVVTHILEARQLLNITT